jgi:MOSC domain-containing protein YiiM
MTHTYPITIHHLYISPGHNYFTHAYSMPGDHPTLDLAQVTVQAGQGIVGDRFYGRGPEFDGHVTFFAWEVFQELQRTVGAEVRSPAALRRNVIIEGVPLNQLIGQEFTIDGVRFYGNKHCAPCHWMDVAVAAGALQLLKGRGGLRAQVLDGGTLHRGPARLTTRHHLDLATISARRPRPNLPG